MRIAIVAALALLSTSAMATPKNNNNGSNHHNTTNYTTNKTTNLNAQAQAQKLNNTNIATGGYGVSESRSNALALGGNSVSTSGDSKARSSANNNGVTVNNNASRGYRNSPDVFVSSGNNTAPCVKAFSISASAMGAGGGVSIPFDSDRCYNERDMDRLQALGHSTVVVTMIAATNPVAAAAFKATGYYDNQGRMLPQYYAHFYGPKKARRVVRAKY